LNELLGSAWEQYKNAIASGEVLELEASYTQFVAEALDGVIDVEVEREAA
jgi:hypothetical protein